MIINAKEAGDWFLLSGIVQQVRLDHNGKFSNADLQGVHSENGPVLVEELGKKYVLLFN